VYVHFQVSMLETLHKCEGIQWLQSLYHLWRLLQLLRYQSI
jgi:hypothetical protein